MTGRWDLLWRGNLLNLLLRDGLMLGGNLLRREDLLLRRLLTRNLLLVGDRMLIGLLAGLLLIGSLLLSTLLWRIAIVLRCRLLASGIRRHVLLTLRCWGISDRCLEVLRITIRIQRIRGRSRCLPVGRSVWRRRRNGRCLRGATTGGIRVPLLVVGLDRISSFGGLGILDGLEDTGFLECLEGILLLETIRVLVFNGHSRAVEGGMCRELDGGFVGYNRLNPMLCSSSSNSVGAHGPNSQCDNADSATDSHAA
jgi:hypothetical protein